MQTLLYRSTCSHVCPKLDNDYCTLYLQQASTYMSHALIVCISPSLRTSLCVDIALSKGSIAMQPGALSGFNTSAWQSIGNVLWKVYNACM